MPIFITNSLTQKKEEFVPLVHGEAGIYTCGVTVYDECHAGHARGAIVFDIIRRYLQFKGYNVRMVRNITDVDDKIIAKAREELGKTGINEESPNALKSAVKEVSGRYLKSYYEDMKALGIKEADIEPKATEHIPDMINIIAKLIEKGYAYESEGDVYYRVRKFHDYGRLSKQTMDEMMTGARIEPNEKKQDPLDFALWKKAKPNEPSWDSPWGKGRPGWHIECSAMSMKYLGPGFDIHGGGRDLIFPHHENEICQSESYSGTKFAKYWLHNGLLTINNEKMSKSSGNFVSIKDVLKKYHPDVLKLFFLSTHYAHPVDFSWARLDEALKARERFYILFDAIDRFLQLSSTEQTIGESSTEGQAKLDMEKLSKGMNIFYNQIEDARNRFEEAMDDDFNTARALSAIFELVNFANRFIEEPGIPHDRKMPILNCAKFTILELGGLLGLFSSDRFETIKGKEDSKLVDDLINLIVELRNYARDKKDFELSDKLRDNLNSMGIVLEDRKGTTTWRRNQGV